MIEWSVTPHFTSNTADNEPAIPPGACLFHLRQTTEQTNLSTIKEGLTMKNLIELPPTSLPVLRHFSPDFLKAVMFARAQVKLSDSYPALRVSIWFTTPGATSCTSLAENWYCNITLAQTLSWLRSSCQAQNRQIFRESCGPETPGKPPDRPTPASACRAVCCVDGFPQWS